MKFIPSGLVNAEETYRGRVEFSLEDVAKVLRLALICVHGRFAERKRCICHGIGTICKSTLDQSEAWIILLHDDGLEDLIDEHWNDHLHLWATIVLELVDNPDTLIRDVCEEEKYDFQFNSTIDSRQTRLVLSLVDSWLMIYPLAWYLAFAAIEKHVHYETRFVVGIGGAAGAGKTTMACILKRFIHLLSDNE